MSGPERAHEAAVREQSPPEGDADLLAARARAEGTPLIDGDTLTFVWLGSDPPPRIIGDWNDWDPEAAVALTRLGGDVHAARLSVPLDAYLEYQLLHPDGRVADPLNRHPFANGIGGTNSCIWMPAAPRHDLARRRADVPRGQVTRHRLGTLGMAVGATRTAWLYRPAVEEPTQLLVVLDGRDYLWRGRLDVILDNLIADRSIAPLAAVFVDNAGRDRLVEYGAPDTTVGFLAGIVVPFAARETGVALPGEPVMGDEPEHEAIAAWLGGDHPQPGPIGILGASMGGLMALHAALRVPWLFGRVLAQSGAYALWGQPSTTLELAGRIEPPAMRIWMDCGRLEWLLDANEWMADTLRARGYDVTYTTYQGGHTYRAWTEDVVSGLVSLFGPGEGR